MADDLLKTLNLAPLPLGGFYAESLHAATKIKPLDDSGREVRDAYSVIYLLLRGSDINAWHKMKSGETYFHHKGSHIILHMISEDGSYETQIIGDPMVDSKARFHCHVPKNVPVTSVPEAQHGSHDPSDMATEGGDSLRETEERTEKED